MVPIFRFSRGNKNKTFKPVKLPPKNANKQQLSVYAKATLGSGNMKSAVALPPKEDLNEWLSVSSFSILFERFPHLADVDRSHVHPSIYNHLYIIISLLWMDR